MKQGKIGKKEIQIIHVAKSQLLMDDAEYRALLQSYSVSTSKDLSYPQYEALLRKFQADGFILKSKKENLYRRQSKASWEKAPMMKKISALLYGMNLPLKYADSIAKHMFSVNFTTWCSPDQLHKIIAALEYKRKKIENKEGFVKCRK